MYSKIQVIKMIRNIPELNWGLKESKDYVDSQDLNAFEDRVIRSFGEGSREELHQWARLFVMKENKPFSYVPNVPDKINDEPYDEDYCCPDCDDNRY